VKVRYHGVVFDAQLVQHENWLPAECSPDGKIRRDGVYPVLEFAGEQDGETCMLAPEAAACEEVHLVWATPEERQALAEAGFDL